MKVHLSRLLCRNNSLVWLGAVLSISILTQSQISQAAELYFPERVSANPAFQKTLIDAVTHQHRTFSYRHEGESVAAPLAGKHIYAIKYGSSFPIAKRLFGRDVVFSNEALPDTSPEAPQSAQRHAWLVRSQGALANFLKSDKTLIDCVAPKQKSAEIEDASDDEDQDLSSKELAENLRQCRVYTKRPQLPETVTQVRTYVPGIKWLIKSWEEQGLKPSEIEARIQDLKQKDVVTSYRNPGTDVLFLQGPPMFQIKVKGEGDPGVDYRQTKAGRYPKWQGPYFYFVIAEVPESYWPVAKKIQQATKDYLGEHKQIKKQEKIIKRLNLLEGKTALKAEYRAKKVLDDEEKAFLKLIATVREDRKLMLKSAFLHTANSMTLEAMTPYYQGRIDNRDFDPSSNQSELPWWAITFGYDEKAGLGIREAATARGIDWSI